MKKKLIIAGVCAAVAAAAVTAGILAYTYAGRISYAGSFSADVNSGLSLERDAGGVLLIRAKTRGDACFGLGYAHAQDRYNLMEYYRAVTAFSSEGLIGRDGRSLDRLSRTIGFAARARALAARIGRPYADYLADYTRGVNEARARLGLHDAVPRSWLPEDVIGILLLKEWANAFLVNRETLFQFPREEGGAALREIIPADLIYYYNENESESAEVVRTIKKLVQKYIGTFDRGYAFYLPAGMMKEDYPATAFSFDDMLSVYPGWYPVHVNIEDRIIKGVSHAGLPFLFAGSNLDISFYGFAADVDTQDFIAETVIKTGKSFQYLGAVGWRDFDAVPAPKKEDAPLRASENGPVLNDVFDLPTYGDSAVALRSLFFEDSYITALFDVPYARSIDEAGVLVRGVRSLPRVYLFATDAASLCAWSGLVPRRKQTDAVFRSGADAFLNGITDISVWTSRGNGPLAVGSSFLSDAPDIIRANETGADKRYSRMKRLLGKKKRLGNRDVENILLDTFSPLARRFLPLFLSIMGDNPIASVRLTRIYFQNWQCRLKTEFVAPSVFHLLLKQFMRETCGDELKDRTDDVMENWYLLAPRFYEIVKENKSQLFDDRTTYTTEYRETIFDRAFLKTMRFLNRSKGPDMNEWTWGSLHRGRFTVPGAKERIDEEPFRGGADSMFRASVGTDLRPLDVTSLSGMFGFETSYLYMNFSYSTHPASEFYYGSGTNVGTVSFHEISGRYITTIKPKKK